MQIAARKHIFGDKIKINAFIDPSRKTSTLRDIKLCILSHTKIYMLTAENNQLYAIVEVSENANAENKIVFSIGIVSELENRYQGERFLIKFVREHITINYMPLYEKNKQLAIIEMNNPIKLL